MRDRWQAVLAKVLNGESYACEEDRLVRADGVVQWFRWAALPRHNEHGGVDGLFLLHVDLTRHKQVEAELRASEERLCLAMEAGEFGVLDYDLRRDGRKYWSPMLYRLAGLPEGSEVNEGTLPGLLHPEDRERFEDALWEAMNPEGGSEQMTLDFRVVRPDRAMRWWRIMSRTWMEGEGEQRRAVRWIGAVVDVTERVQMGKRLEEALLWSDEERRSIVAAAPVAVVTYTSTGIVTSWNPAAERMYGYREADVKGRRDPTLPEEGDGALVEVLAGVLRGENYQGEVRRVQADGSEMDVMLLLAPLHGNRAGVVALAEDIPPKKRAAAELVQVRAALQSAREEEARRIARELHDDTTQRLSLLSVDLGRLATIADTERITAEELRALQERVIEISQSLRELSHQLHPTVLDDLGLETALEELGVEFSSREAVPVSFVAQMSPEPVPTPVASCLYRVAQEALHNVAKYAQARRVEMRLARKDNALELMVLDEGNGFQLDEVKGGLGLHSMRERLELVNGSFEIDSVPGEGTRVVARVPLTE